MNEDHLNEKSHRCTLTFYSKEHNFQKNDNITERQKKKPNLSDLTDILWSIGPQCVLVWDFSQKTVDAVWISFTVN